MLSLVLCREFLIELNTVKIFTSLVAMQKQLAAKASSKAISKAGLGMDLTIAKLALVRERVVATITEVSRTILSGGSHTSASSSSTYSHSIWGEIL